MKTDKCPHLRVWLATTCAARGASFVLIPFVVGEFCSTHKFSKCPLNSTGK
jgi:hypothetical protein